jgi:ABC-type sugar transport system substrate-binding protein
MESKIVCYGGINLKKRILSSGLIVLLLLALCFGVVNAKEYTVLVMPKLIGIPYFNASEKGAREAGKDLGVNVIYAGPTQADAASQVKMIEDYISKGVDAICVAPNDPAALTPVLKKARQKGIIILDWDTPADKSVVDISIHQIDDKVYGEHIWDLFVKKLGKSKGNYAILTGGLEAENLNTWINYGIAHAKKKYPQLRLVTERIPTNENQQEAYMKTLNLLKAYPKLDGIVALSSPAPIGAAQAVREKGLKNKVTVVGIAIPSQARPYLKSGDLKAATLWDPSVLGYFAVYMATQKITGKKIYDGMVIPKIGKIEVKPDGKTVVMGPPTDFLAENVDKFNF